MAPKFNPQNAILARVLAMGLCLCVCLSQASIVSKWQQKSSWFLTLHCILRKLRYLLNWGYFLLECYPNYIRVTVKVTKVFILCLLQAHHKTIQWSPVVPSVQIKWEKSVHMETLD